MKRSTTIFLTLTVLIQLPGCQGLSWIRSGSHPLDQHARVHSADRGEPSTVDRMIKDLSTRDNVLTLKAASKASWTVESGVQLLSQMLLSLYQVLNLSRQIGKAQS